jgi:hypothetical protein
MSKIAILNDNEVLYIDRVKRLGSQIVFSIGSNVVHANFPNVNLSVLCFDDLTNAIRSGESLFDISEYKNGTVDVSLVLATNLQKLKTEAIEFIDEILFIKPEYIELKERTEKYSWDSDKEKSGVNIGLDLSKDNTCSLGEYVSRLKHDEKLSVYYEHLGGGVVTIYPE